MNEILLKVVHRFFPQTRHNADQALEKMAEVLETCQRLNIYPIVPSGEAWNARIGVWKPPPLLFFRGKLILNRTHLALVGTRFCSALGVRAALSFSRVLSEQGIGIFSGLARGIDSYCHRGALQAHGYTVAILAHGLDSIYPPENRDLAEEIIKSGGALVSEFPPGVSPRKEYFPRRNAVMAGLTDGVVIVEAPEKSGALITARHALDMGKEVYCVAGGYHMASFRGGGRWVQSGATLVLDPQDILDDLQTAYWHRTSLFHRTSEIFSLSAWTEKLAELESYWTLEDALQLSGLTLPEVQRWIAHAEIEGAIQRVAPQTFVSVSHNVPCQTRNLLEK